MQKFCFGTTDQYVSDLDYRTYCDCDQYKISDIPIVIRLTKIYRTNVVTLQSSMHLKKINI
jgi:hypothetical protein